MFTNSPIALSSRRLRTVGIVFVTIAIVWIYRDSFTMPFFYSEDKGIQNNPVVRSGAMFLSRMISLKGFFQRPLSVLSYRLNFIFGAENVWGYHFVNLLIHILNTIALFFLAQKWT